MTHPTLPSPAASAESLPPELREFAQELAVAVHKRGIYPAGHPMQRGAVEAVAARLGGILAERASLSIGVGRTHLLFDGVPTDPNHPLLSELSGRMHDHLLGGVRLSAGISPVELDELVSLLAESPSRGGGPLGARAGELLEQWRCVQVMPVAFDQLALLDAEAEAEGQGTGAPAAPPHEVWTALAQVALAGGADDGTLQPPAVLAAAVEQQLTEAQGRRAVVDALLRALDALDVPGGGDAALRQQVTQLMELLSEDAIRHILSMEGDREKRHRFLHKARHVLGARAVVELVRVAAAQDGAPVSASMLRLLQKFARGATAGRSGGRAMDQALRRVVGRLLDDWTLEDPNPEMYSAVLAEVSQSAPAGGRDRHRDTCEPERIVEISLDAGIVSPSTETALARLVMRDGVATTLERLMRYPLTPVRESLEGRLVNDAMLREQLAAERPEVPVITHAVDRLRERAIEPLLVALARRAEGDAEWLVGMLVRLGGEVLAPLAAAVPTLPPRALRHAITVFDRLQRWPPGVDPLALARHADVHVRREAIRALLNGDETRERGIRIGLADPDLKTLGLVLGAAMRHCSPEAARLLMRRFDDPALGGEVRARIARTIASVRSPETLAWLVSQVLTRRWFTGAPRLRKPSSEVVAIVAAIAQHHRGDPTGEQVLQLARKSRDRAMRLAAMTRGEGTGAST